MDSVIVSFVTGKREYFVAADRWVHTLRDWQKFRGDIIIFVNDNAPIPDSLRRRADLRPLKPALQAAKEFKTNNARGDIFMLKPFVLRHALASIDHDVVMMADIDALAVRPVDPMFETVAKSRKIFVPHGMDRIYTMAEADAHRGFFTNSERTRFDRMKFSPMCAGFTLGVPKMMKVLVDAWIDILATKKYRKDGRPGLQEQSALNYWLLKNPLRWQLMPEWICPFDGPFWQRPKGDTLIWHFYGSCLKRHRKTFAIHDKGRRSW